MNGWEWKCNMTKIELRRKRKKKEEREINWNTPSSPTIASRQAVLRDSKWIGRKSNTVSNVSQSGKVPEWNWKWMRRKNTLGKLRIHLQQKGKGNLKKRKRHQKQIALNEWSFDFRVRTDSFHILILLVHIRNPRGTRENVWQKIFWSKKGTTMSDAEGRQSSCVFLCSLSTPILNPEPRLGKRIAAGKL